MPANVVRPDPNSTVLLVCDIQVKFSAHYSHWATSVFADDEPGDAIHGFDEVVATTNKMLKIAKVRVVRRSNQTSTVDTIRPPDRYLISPSS